MQGNAKPSGAGKWLWYVERENELFIDADDPHRKGRRDLVLERLARCTLVKKVVRVAVAPSATPGNWHIAVELRVKLNETMRSAWRLRLGSDIFHEAHNMKRIALGVKYPNLLIRQTPIPGWRKSDAICECPEKHGAHPACEPGRRFRSTDTMNFFRDGSA